MSAYPGFIYGLIDPRTRMNRYVGLAIRPNRPFAHRRCVNGDWDAESTHKVRWIRELWSAGFDYEVCYLEYCDSWSQLCLAEKWWIAFLGRTHHGTGVLTNATDGGEGTINISEEARAKISRFHTGRQKSIETCDRIAEAKIGTTASAEVREKMSIAHRRENLSAETRAKLSASQMGNTALLGHVHTEETRIKLSAANIGRIRSAEHRAKLGDAHRGKITSAETKAKISATKRRRYWLRCLATECYLKLVVAMRRLREQKETT